MADANGRPQLGDYRIKASVSPLKRVPLFTAQKYMRGFWFFTKRWVDLNVVRVKTEDEAHAIIEADKAKLGRGRIIPVE